MKLQAQLLCIRPLPILLALAVMASMMSGCFVGDSIGTASAWVDANCNGVRDPEEAPLAGVCNWMSTDASVAAPSPEECADEELQTDSDGIGGWGFFAGAWCHDVYVFAQAPDGFEPTTDTAVNDCQGEFGFAPEGTCPPHASVTPGGLAFYKRIRGLACVFGGPAVVALLVLGYRKFRRDTLARRDRLSGE